MKLLKTCIILVFLLIPTTTFSAEPHTGARTKFYNFDELLIDGEIKKPTGLYTDSRSKVKFERLLRLKKSFMGKLMDTARDPVFK